MSMLKGKAEQSDYDKKITQSDINPRVQQNSSRAATSRNASDIDGKAHKMKSGL
jgi:hypothetical protein